MNNITHLFHIITSAMPITSMLAQTDGEILRTIREPGFADFVVYVLVLIMIVDKVSGWFNRGKPSKTVVTGSVETSEAFKAADAKDVAEMKRQIDDLRVEQEALHNATLKAGENRVTDLSKVMDRETKEVKDRMDDLEEKLLNRFDQLSSKITEKLTALAVNDARHDEAIPNLSNRVSDLSARYNETIPKIHDRINDLMQRSAGKR